MEVNCFPYFPPAIFCTFPDLKDVLRNNFILLMYLSIVCDKFINNFLATV